MLDAFVDHIAMNESLGDSMVLHRMMDMLSLAPYPELVATIGRLDVDSIDTLLRVGAGDTLALRLIGADNGFFVSRGASGEYLVSVVLANGGEETTASGPSLLRAVVCALAQALAQQGRAHCGDHPMAHHRCPPLVEATLH